MLFDCLGKKEGKKNRWHVVPRQDSRGALWEVEKGELGWSL
jgi:hypothetical protein